MEGWSRVLGIASLEMRCGVCEQKFEVNQNADVQICPHCKHQPKRLRPVPKLEPASKSKIYRVDNAHPLHKANKQAAVRNEDDLIRRAQGWLTLRSMTHAVIFGMSVFLLGQVSNLYAFAYGSRLLWGIASLLSAIGVTVAFAAAIITLRNLERRIKDLAKDVSRQQATNKRRKFESRAENADA